MPAARRHLLFLDLVRGLSAMAVLVGHSANIAWGLGGRPNFFYVQSWAVVVFLALSGFLIGGSVQRRVSKGTFTLAGYMKDRSARILVPYLPLIPIVVLGDRLFLGQPPRSPFVASLNDGWGAIVSNALMLQDNWLVQVVDELFGTDLSRRSLGSAAPWWTVALEWWIYIAFACLFAVVAGLTRHKVSATVAGILALITVMGSSFSGNMLISAWIVGIALAWWDPQLSPRAWRGITVTATGGLLWFLWLKPGAVYSFPVVVATSVMVLAGFKAWSWDVLKPAERPIRFLADYSYSLYLIHFSVLVWLAAMSPGTRGWRFILIGFVLGNVAAIASWALFERHFPTVRRWLDKPPLSRSSA